jgi:hypothetical protein
MLVRRHNLTTIALTISGAAVALGMASVVLGRMLRRRDARFARAIVGNTRDAVASVLGPPRVATFVGAEGASGNFHDANLWYYPLPKRKRMGIAIRFGERHAEAVEFFQSPVDQGPH